MAGRIVSLLLLLLAFISFAIARAPVDAAPVYVGDLVSLIEVIKQTSSVAVWGSSFFAWIEGGRGFGCVRRLWLLLVLRFFRSSTTHALYMGRVRGDWILLPPLCDTVTNARTAAARDGGLGGCVCQGID